jgi:tRNA 2-thiouridine synthesizing protein C
MVDATQGTRPEPKKFMLLNRRAPHGTVYALEALEVVLIAATFDQDVSLVFLDDGVFSQMKNFSLMYRALDDYDVNKLYVERESMESRGLKANDLLVEVEVLDRKELSERMEQQDVLLSF